MSGTAVNRQQEVVEIVPWDTSLALCLLKCVRTCLEAAFVRSHSFDVGCGPSQQVLLLGSSVCVCVGK